MQHPPAAMESGCLLIPSFPMHYPQLEHNLRSLRKFASDTSMPPVHIVLDTIKDVAADGSRFAKLYSGSVEVHSLQGLMRDAGEDAYT